MAKKYNSILGVDIGSQTIKIAEVRLQGRQPSVTALGMAQTPEGAVDHIGVHDSESVGQVLKQLCASSGVSVGDVVVSMAGQGSVLVRTLEVPNMNESELKQHMDWEITRNIPFAESTVVSDFKAFPPESAAAQNMDVVMAISPQSAVDLIVDMVKKAGKKTEMPTAEELVGLPPALETATDLIGEADEGETAMAGIEVDEGQMQNQKILEQVGEMVTKDPGSAARLLNRWIEIEQ